MRNAFNNNKRTIAKLPKMQICKINQLDISFGGFVN